MSQPGEMEQPEAPKPLAAEAVAAYENRLISMEAKLDRLDTRIRHTRMEMRTWGGLAVGIALSILWRVWH